MTNRAIIGGIVGAFLVLIALLSCVYTVNMREQAILLQFNAPQAVITDPGLHFKLPFVQDVQRISKQLLNIEAPTEEVIALDKKRLLVDSFARWRVTNPLRFYQALTDQETAVDRLTPILSSSVRRVLGSENFSAVLSAKRAQLMRDIRDDMNNETRDFGIVIVDVRIRHADLPSQNSQAIYNRMIQERRREANEFRAQGEEISQRIRARADREVTVLKAQATRESEILRGEGDAQKTKIFADAYGQDPDFFAFYRSMEAYKDALEGDSTTLMLSPSSDFLRYFNEGAAPKGRK